MVPRHSDRTRGWLSIVLSALVLSAVALAKGQPFFCTDTTAYVRGAEMGLTALFGQRFRTDLLPASPPLASEQAASAANSSQGPSTNRKTSSPGLTSIEDKIVLSGRSVYYGAFLYFAYVTSGFWLALAVHALAVAYMLHLLIVRMWGLGERALLATVAVLVVVTPLGAYTGLLVPDIFAPLVILAMGTLALYWQTLHRSDIVAIGSILFAGLISHASHIAIAALLWLLLAVMLRAHLPVRALLLSGLCIAGALAAEYAFTRTVTAMLGQPPLRLPYVTAHLIDTGPGTDFLRSTCPASGYTACKYVANYPTQWEKFMFSTDPAQGAFALASPDEKRRMSQEQFPLAVDVLRRDPVRTLGVLGMGAIEQLAAFDAYLFYYGPDVLDSYRARLPQGVLERMQHNRITLSPWWSHVVTLLTYASVALALVAGAALLSGRQLDVAEARTRLRSFLIFVIAGVVVNAVVCGVLASPNDRFQARVIWLVPLVAIVGWMSWRRAAAQGAMRAA